MNMRGRKFEVDRANGKIAGVCAGFANMTGIDVTIVRVALVLLTLTIAFPWSLIAYAVAAFAGQPKRGYARCEPVAPGLARRDRASGSATSTSGCRRSRPTSPARTAASPARSRSCAEV